MKQIIWIDTLQLPESTSSIAVNLFQKKLIERGITISANQKEATLIISLGIDPGIGSEGFRIEEINANHISIYGNDQLGLIYGIGKFLRTAEYLEGEIPEFKPDKFPATSIPDRKIRGIYFATHFRNYYHCAPFEEIETYIEDLALWGINAIAVWFDMHHFHSLDDPDAQAMITRLRFILITAKKIGMDIGLLVLANEAYRDSPIDLRADWSTGHDGYFGNQMPMYQVELCPSIPAGYELILHWKKQVFEVFSDLEIDYLIIWPYDQGGCSCSKCAPWGGNGFLKIAKPISALARRFFPKIKVILSTWYFDSYIHGEWEAFHSQIEKNNDWVDFIMTECSDHVLEYLLEKGIPGSLPLVGFPEISMFENAPWGGFGANPLPLYLQRMWDRFGKLTSGGFAYSEGIFEDINKAIVAYQYWEGNSDIEKAVEEYCKLYFIDWVKNEFLNAVLLLEKTNKRDRYLNGKLEWMPVSDEITGYEQFIIVDTTDVDKAHEILKYIDSQLPPSRRSSWRWRILYLRGKIDHELLKNNFEINESCEKAFEELIRIYHAQNSIWAVKPPSRHNRILSW